MTCAVTELPDLTLPAPTGPAWAIFKPAAPAQASMLWDVTLSIKDIEQCHTWRGWAFNSRHAVELARTDFYELVQLSRQRWWTYPTRAIYVVQVSA